MITTAPLSAEEKQVQERLGLLGIPLPFPEPVPEGVRCVNVYAIARAWRIQKNQFHGLFVLGDVSIKDDGQLWYHVSFSRSKAIPNYGDCMFVKRTFFGADRWAIQIFPEDINHVNQHPKCLHLWHCLEGKPFPEFSKNGMI